MPPQLTFASCVAACSAAITDPDINNAAAAVANNKPEVFFDVLISYPNLMMKLPEFAASASCLTASAL
jgi:hypothetical protein